MNTDKKLNKKTKAIRNLQKARYLKKKKEKDYEVFIYNQIEHLLLQGKTCHAVYNYLKANNIKTLHGKDWDYRNVYRLVNKNFNS